MLLAKGIANTILQSEKNVQRGVSVAEATVETSGRLV